MAVATPSRSVRVSAPVNIALVKYWGKRDEDRMLPHNDSVSVTLDAFRVTTTVRVHPRADGDGVRINGTAQSLPGSRFERVFAQARRLLRRRKADGSAGADPAAESICLSFEVDSTADFPANAGLASSAAGFAAIAFAIGQLFDLPANSVDYLARMGSGSACRSVAGGFAHWYAGVDPTGADCKCESFGGSDHWPGLVALVAVCSDRPKAVPSSIGMQRSAATSDYFKHRLTLLPDRVATVRKAICTRDFATMAGCTMRDSNALHAICADTSPPIFYLNATSHRVIDLVETYNAGRPQPVVAYTFDAGANALLMLERPALAEFVAAFLRRFAGTKTIGLAEVLPELDQVTGPKDDGPASNDEIAYLRFSEVGGRCEVLSEPVS